MTRTRIDWMLIVGMLALFFAALAHSAAFAAETPSYVLTTKHVNAQISKHLADLGAAEKVEATVMSQSGTMFIRHDAPLQVEISSLTFDVNGKRWSAYMRISSDGKLLQEQELNGRFAAVVSVPVLNRRLTGNDVISDIDIAWQDVPENRLRRDTIMDESRLIGKAPRRVISQNRPIREHEVEQPVAVERGKLVQVHFNHGGVHIRTMAEANEDGSVGDIIRVRNVDSGNILQARVLSASDTEVIEYNQLTSAQSYR